MHKGCKGCRDEKSLCAKQNINSICPCLNCLVKPMCAISCELLKVFVAENLEDLKAIHSRMIKIKESRI